MGGRWHARMAIEESWGGEHGSLGLEFQGAGRIRLGRGEVGVHEKGLGLLGRFVFWCSLR